MLVAGGYFDDRFWTRRVAYRAYVDGTCWRRVMTATSTGNSAIPRYKMESRQTSTTCIEQTRLALEYMKDLRAAAQV